MKKNQANQVLKEQRLQQIIDALVNGKMTWQIIAEFTEQWKCGNRSVEKYIHAAKKKIKEHWQQKDLTEDLFQKFINGYQIALMNKNLPEARKNIEAIAKYGLGEKHTVIISEKTKWGNDEPGKTD
jgi:hypothetical protein